LIDAANKEIYNEECFDWSRTRPPLLSVQAKLPDSLSPVEEVVYFGRHWDSEDGIEALTAAKADDAEVDLSLWNVGGNGNGMEEAQKVISNILHSRWVQCLTLEAASFFGSQSYSDLEERECDCEALLECIK
jgi:hypothetical protein